MAHFLILSLPENIWNIRFLRLTSLGCKWGKPNLEELKQKREFVGLIVKPETHFGIALCLWYKYFPIINFELPTWHHWMWRGKKGAQVAFENQYRQLSTPLPMCSAWCCEPKLLSYIKHGPSPDTGNEKGRRGLLTFITTFIKNQMPGSHFHPPFVLRAQTLNPDCLNLNSSTTTCIVFNFEQVT